MKGADDRPDGGSAGFPIRVMCRSLSTAATSRIGRSMAANQIEVEISAEIGERDLRIAKGYNADGRHAAALPSGNVAPKPITPAITTRATRRATASTSCICG